MFHSRPRRANEEVLSLPNPAEYPVGSQQSRAAARAIVEHQKKAASKCPCSATGLAASVQILQCGGGESCVYASGGLRD
jgi:hypothetical protein